MFSVTFSFTEFLFEFYENKLSCLFSVVCLLVDMSWPSVHACRALQGERVLRLNSPPVLWTQVGTDTRVCRRLPRMIMKGEGG